MKTKREIYAEHEINYFGGKITAPHFGGIQPLLINGNDKLGKGVWTFSVLPGTGDYTATVNGITIKESGTCPCDCAGCYAKTGRYNMENVIAANALKTFLARRYPEFVEAAVIAQIKADKIKLCRIHAAGEFFSARYIQLWVNVARACPECRLWTYTKYGPAENAFDGVSNVNVVKSIIPGCGLNFGHCGYILDTYNKLTAAGKQVYICRCGIDKNQHCTNCRGCANNDYVLFIEHSTEYRAAADTAFPALRDVIENQPKA